jgi:hypothetical protein
MTKQVYASYGGMSMERYNEHMQTLKECEAGGVTPHTYRELLTVIGRMRARLIELELRADCCSMGGAKYA